MKAKTQFLKMFHKLPENAKTELVMDFSTNPKTLRVCCNEIYNNTELGKKLLLQLGYTDD